MRRIFSLALSLMIFAVMLCSCSEDDNIIKLTMEKTTYPTNTKIVTYTIKNAENTVLNTGESYLEKYDNDTWTKVEVNVPVYVSSFRIEPNESKELSLPVTDTDTIEKGKYRVCLEISISEITGELTTLVSDDGEEFTFNNVDPETSKELTVYGEFTVE